MAMLRKPAREYVTTEVAPRSIAHTKYMNLSNGFGRVRPR